MARALSELLRAAVESGDWSRLRDRLAHDAVLDTSNETGRRRIEGPDAIAAHLGRPGPGAIRDWDAQEWPTGVALSFEGEGATGTDRRRWYLRTNPAGEVVELWSTAARPLGTRSAAVVTPPAALLQRLGAVRVVPMSHGGNSGAILLRAERDDGTRFVLKRSRRAVLTGSLVPPVTAAARLNSTRQAPSSRCPPRSATGSSWSSAQTAPHGSRCATSTPNCCRRRSGSRASRTGASSQPRRSSIAPSATAFRPGSPP
jgi:hypothetical protein